MISLSPWVPVSQFLFVALETSYSISSIPTYIINTPEVCGVGILVYIVGLVGLSRRPVLKFNPKNVLRNETLVKSRHRGVRTWVSLVALSYMVIGL